MSKNENIEDPLEWLNEPPESAAASSTPYGNTPYGHTEGTDDEPELPVDPRELKPRALGNSIMRVYRQLGGDRWLLAQAQENSKEFLGLIKAIVPKNLDVGFDTDITILIAPKEDVEPIGVQTEQHRLESNRKPIKLQFDPVELREADSA